MGKIFGTDGARGVAGSELDAALALGIGKAAAKVIAAASGRRPKVLIGRDTRISCDMLESAVAAGLCSVGADVVLLGVVPTPAVSYLTRLYRADAGVMISASHNSFEFNGIKLFGPSGLKLTDAQEDAIEQLILYPNNLQKAKTGAEVGSVSHADGAAEDYIEFLAANFKGGFDGKVLVDCANGSASATAQRLFERVGVAADFIYDQPNGVNINENCGSTHVAALAKRVVAGGYDVGLAFDGDADRLISVDGAGNILDGDFMLSIFAQYMQATKRLENNAVAVTTMSNMGFFKLMKQKGISSEITKVGDRYVLERMRQSGIWLGGEQSGHIIFLDRAATGDGQLSALELLDAVAFFEQPLHTLASEMKKFPQTMVNTPATAQQKANFETDAMVARAIEHWQTKLGERGRVVVRPSGTEPFIRVMAEGENLEEIERCVNEISDAIKRYL